MTAATMNADNATSDNMHNQLDYHNQYVSFWLDGQLLGVPVIKVQEVLNPQSIARTPQARTEIAGLLNLRGQIVTAVNLRKRMGLKDFENDEECMNVVFHHNGEPFSLLVDDVGDVINVPSETMEPVPQTLDERWKKVTSGIFQLEDRLFIILNVGAILDLG